MRLAGVYDASRRRDRSGKTVTMALAALAAIKCRVGVIVIDPKPDEFLLGLLRDAAGRAGR